MKPLYINGMGCISPQPSFGQQPFPFEAKEYHTSRLSCIEPDYTPYLDPKTSRRMGRLLKFGTAAGLQALRDAGVANPDAISTGTGFGLLEDSGKFLKNVIEADEGVVSPTAFIQSTHNTVSSNIALMVGCHAHNNTFSHKGFSFESALTDAQMLAGESESMRNILVGAYDEATDYSYAIMHRLGLIQTDSINLDLLKDAAKGTIAGEGSAFFVLSTERADCTYSIYRGNTLVHKPASIQNLADKLDTFLKNNDLTLQDIDIVISGLTGDPARDKFLQELNGSKFPDQTILGYKHLCGEYMTSTAFALWMGAMIAQSGQIPVHSLICDRSRKAGNILICNSYKDNYSFLLLSSM